MTQSATSPDDPQSGAPGAGLTMRIKQLISNRIAVAIGWTALVTIVSQVLRLASTLIMTRLLVPEMFGVMAIVLSVHIILANLMDIGLRAAIIHSPRGNDPELLNTAWTIQIIRGFVISFVVLMIALALPGISGSGLISADTAWASPALPLVLAVTCLSPILNSFESTNTITAERNLALKRFTSIKLAAQLISFACMVLIGVLTRSIWALVAGSIIATIVVTVLSHTMLPGIRNRLAWNKEARTELAKYGSWVLLSSAATVLAAQADRLFFGGLIDSGTLGLYSIALNLALLVEMLASTCVWSVFMPALSEAHRESFDNFRRKYFKLRLLLDAGLVTTAGGLFAAGPLVIEILYDDRYLAAGNMLQALSFILLFARYNLTNAAYMACGKPQVTASVNIIKCISLFVFLYGAFEFFGFDGALYAVSLHALPSLVMLFYINHKNNLSDLRFEAGILLAWPLGYVLGLAFVEVVHLFL